MMRLGIVIALLVLIAGVGFYVGQRWDDRQDTQQEINTIEGANDAQENAGDCTASWLECLLKHRGD